MYRSTAKRSLRSLSKRQFSSSFLKLNEVKPKLPGETIVITPPKKVSHPIRKFFVRIGLLTSVIYIGGVTLLMKNDTIYDNFVDYFPWGEELIDFTENKILNYNTNSAAIDSELPSFNSMIEKTIPITKSGVFSSPVDEEELKKLEAAKEEVKVNIVDTNAPNITTEAALPLIEFKSGDDLLNKTIESFNDVIRSINHKAPIHKTVINAINENIKELSNKLSHISADYDRSMSELAGSKNENLKFLVEQKEVDLTKEYIKQLNLQKDLIEKKYHEIMINEIEAAKKTIFAQSDNKFESMKLQQLNEFNRIISDKIDNERDSKLAKLDQVFAKIEKLQQVEIGIGKELSNYQYLKNLQVELSKITSILNNSSKPIILNEQFDKLTKLVSDLNDELLIESINQLPKDGNLLTKQQLITRWKLLVPELKSASLLPPNAGILGHFTSRILSKFLFSKEGFAEGNDIESIISRVNGYLERDELDSAVEQVANLKGWSRKLADDWVKESRKRLEVEFLINVIEVESRLLA